MRRIALSGRGRAVCLAAAALASIPPNGSLAQSAGVGGSVEASTGQGASAATTAQADAKPAAEPAPASTPEQEEEKWRERELRTSNTYYGPVGGIFVVDAGSGAPKSFRLQLITDFSIKSDYLYKGDTNRYVGNALSLGITPIRGLEFSAAVSTRSNRNSKTDPEVLQAVGDMHFDVKAYGEPIKGFTVGGDAQVVLLSALNGVGTDPSATSIGLRGNFSADLRKLAKHEFPLIVRLNGGYYFDNSSKLVESTEQARLQNIADQSGQTIKVRNEYRQFVRRDERLALGIDRVDHAMVALGGEMPLEFGKNWGLHPIAEWGLEIPVNRQGFDCPYIAKPGGGKVGGIDTCLGNAGVDTWRQRVTVGARLFPVLRGLNVLAAVDLGVGGSTNFVQELAPNLPYRVMLSASYTADLKPKPPVIKEVEKRVEVAMAPPPQGMLHGTVVEQGTQAMIADAKVSFPGRNVNPLLSHVDGSFLSYVFAPGEVQLEVEAAGYRSGTCAGVIPPEGGEVAVTCELVALPRVGSVNGRVVNATDGTTLAGVALMLSGPAMRSITTDSSGHFLAENLAPGEYHVRIEQAGYLISVTPIDVKVREESTPTIQLLPTPKSSSVQVQKDRIKIRGSIFFTTDTANIEARSEPLLTEIADVIMRNPELLQVEVQGHTDDVGTPDHNLDLSQRRADAVKEWLVQAGVERDRLVAKGYGMDKPIVPNLTTQNRAKNRRVEFLILRRAGE